MGSRSYGKEKKKKKKKEMGGLKERSWDRKERHKTGKGRRKKEVKRERELGGNQNIIFNL
jgi:hypothetical protein